MEIITDISLFRKDQHPKLVLALGNFDGIHLGHLDILKKVRERAREIGGTSAVFTFKEHPQRILHRREDPPILTSLIHKLHLLEQTVDLCFLIDFTFDLSKKSPEDFVHEILLESLGAKEICLGFNARFGRNRSGDSQLMKQLAVQYGFVFHEIAPFRVGEKVVSSSLIRSLIQEGNSKAANKLLGRAYSFFGTVVPGIGRGKGLGFPTANLDPHSEVMPPEGVYAVWVDIWDSELADQGKGKLELKERLIQSHLKGLLNYGRKPTFGAVKKPIPEIYIFDFNEDVMNKTIEVVIGKRLRSEQTFYDQETLVSRIRSDVECAEEWFANQN
jgi:riboflavin kinase/FMN adenylyltransferase